MPSRSVKDVPFRCSWPLVLLAACLAAHAGFAQVSVQPGVLELEREQGVAGIPGDGSDREVDAADATGPGLRLDSLAPAQWSLRAPGSNLRTFRAGS
ncbi:MAG: hypothetical protein V2I57_08895 [Xanthomonadales bacterium]|nr:hypothetical protein [Xanthomonadales bacterium]